MFAYQGRFTDGSNAYNGNIEFEPTLWNDASAGVSIATNNPAALIVSASNGESQPIFWISSPNKQCGALLPRPPRPVNNTSFFKKGRKQLFSSLALIRSLR